MREGKAVLFGGSSLEWGFLAFLESVSDLADRLKQPRTDKRPFADVVSEVVQATLLVLVY